jgi:chromosome segregation ATPase
MIEATLPSHGAVSGMDDDEHSSAIAGWVAGFFGLLLALISWGREAWKHHHKRKLKEQEQSGKVEEKKIDITKDFAERMLARIAALEEREKSEREQMQKREETLRIRIEKVEGEADECQRNYAVLLDQHRVLLRDQEDLREENDALREEIERVRMENGTLYKQNRALADELTALYKEMGLKRSAPPLPVMPAPKVPPKKK